MSWTTSLSGQLEGTLRLEAVERQFNFKRKEVKVENKGNEYSEEKCSVCGELLYCHSECDNSKCYAYGSLVFCDHECEDGEEFYND